MDKKTQIKLQPAKKMRKLAGSEEEQVAKIIREAATSGLTSCVVIKPLLTLNLQKKLNKLGYSFAHITEYSYIINW